ncbi:hypothetical protein [Aquisphaera insulae]|uniref:hypothetical protein n=1 Tax=Aquisphaera insulae TaxID=2712864 RepID=UPI0013EB2AEF|nr:hypothetical protein [Aquisphaera insulae]
MPEANDVSTVIMACDNLAVVSENGRLPLSDLEADSHVHGRLQLEIASRQVPYLGYWGPDDVCFGDWLVELSVAARSLASAGGRHVFDEGEQGQPAFVFERDGDRGFFRITASEVSGADGDPAWHRVEFTPTDFIGAFQKLQSSFVATLREFSPAVADVWLARNLRESGRIA